MSIADLRAKALAYSPVMPVPVVLDRDLKYRLQEAQKTLAALQKDRDKIVTDGAPTGQRYDEATPTARIDEQIAAAEQALTAAEDAVRPDSLVLIFRRLPATGPGSYQEMLEAHTDKGAVEVTKLSDALLDTCYLRTESADGEDVGLSFAEATVPLDHGDIETLRTMIIGHHRVGTAVSFDPRSSGRPATS